MGIGAGIFLIAIGAILKFGVSDSVSGVDLPTIGVILMVVGVLGIVLDLVLFAPRRRRTSAVTTSSAPVGSTTVTERTDVI